MGPKKRDANCATACNKYNKQKKRGLCVGKKVKENNEIKNKVKKVVKQQIEYSENETSNWEFSERGRNHSSTESIIYVGTFNTESNQCQNGPIIDLTKTKEKLKTLFFNDKHFKRDFKLKKSLSMSSLANTQKSEKIIPRKLKSTSILPEPNSKLLKLEIPSQFLSHEDLLFKKDIDFSTKCNLTESDENFIKWLIQKENDAVYLDSSLDSTSSECDSSISLDLSIDHMVDIYEVSSTDSFN